MGGIRTFDAIDVATLTTCICMKPGMGEAQAVLEHVLGHPVWTHEMGFARASAMPLILAQWPDAPLDTDPRIVSGRWKEVHDELLGKTVGLKRGNETRASDPVSTLKAALASPLSREGREGE